MNSHCTNFPFSCSETRLPGAWGAQMPGQMPPQMPSQLQQMYVRGSGGCMLRWVTFTETWVRAEAPKTGTINLLFAKGRQHDLVHKTICSWSSLQIKKSSPPSGSPVHLPAPAVYWTLPVPPLRCARVGAAAMGAMLGSLCMGAYGLVLAVNMLWAAGLMKLLSREAKGDSREQHRKVNGRHCLTFIISIPQRIGGPARF